MSWREVIEDTIDNSRGQGGEGREGEEIWLGWLLWSSGLRTEVRESVEAIPRRDIEKEGGYFGPHQTFLARSVPIVFDIASIVLPHAHPKMAQSLPT